MNSCGYELDDDEEYYQQQSSKQQRQKVLAEASTGGRLAPSILSLGTRKLPVGAVSTAGGAPPQPARSIPSALSSIYAMGPSARTPANNTTTSNNGNSSLYSSFHASQQQQQALASRNSSRITSATGSSASLTRISDHQPTASAVGGLDGSSRSSLNTRQRPLGNVAVTAPQRSSFRSIPTGRTDEEVVEVPRQPMVRGPPPSQQVKHQLQAPPPPPPATTGRQIAVYLWQCQECFNSCNVMRSENRCICGHRFKDHNVKRAADGVVANGGSSGKADKCPCTVAKCICKDFFYMVAEGAWIVRCRCKHKHVEHDANPPYMCTKCKPPVGGRGRGGGGVSTTGACCGFDSPFVCNCNHPWSSHKQVWELRTASALPAVLDDFGDPNLVKRGLDDDY